jgi:hypothetical protein
MSGFGGKGVCAATPKPVAGMGVMVCSGGLSVGPVVVPGVGDGVFPAWAAGKKSDGSI